MDRLSQLRGEAGGSGDSTLDTTSPPSEAYMSANENSSKYFSLSDSTFDITQIKDVPLASTSADADRSLTDADELISNLSPIGKKDMLDGYEIGKQIEAANILSGGVEIFDDNENSFDGDELVIDDNAESDDKSNADLADSIPTDVEEAEDVAQPELDSEPDQEALVGAEANIASREMEVVLQINGSNVDAIDIGNGLYLYRKDGQDELAAIQILDDDPQHSFKFLKVRDNAEGNLEVYEEIEIEVPKEVPTKEEKNTPHVPVKDFCKTVPDLSNNKVVEGKNKSPQKESVASTSTSEKDIEDKEQPPDSKTEVNLNGKMMKFSESRKSPVVGSFTPMTFHSTPSKEGKPLTKTMVDLQLHPNRYSDNVKKTIEVHTDNIKLKSAESLVKEKESVDNVKSADTISLEKENSSKANIKSETKVLGVKKMYPNKKMEETLSVDKEASEITEETPNCQNISAHTQLAVQVQSKISAKSTTSAEKLIETGNKSDKIKKDIVLKKEIITTGNNTSDVVIPKQDYSVVIPPSNAKDKNDAESSTTAKLTDIKKIETTGKAIVEEIKIVGKDSVSRNNEDIDKSVKNINERRSPTDMEKVTKNETVLDNSSQAKRVVNESGEAMVEISMKSDEDLRVSLEMFSDVSSTSLNLGTEESKPESITLYSIDTDESVSLITPSSTTNKSEEKENLSSKISEVLTKISNNSYSPNENTIADKQKVKVYTPTLKETNVEVKNQVDSFSKTSDQASSSKSVEKPKEIEKSNVQKVKTTEDKKRSTLVPEMKVSEKAALSMLPKVKTSENLLTSIPVPLVISSEKSKLSIPVLKVVKPIDKVGHSIVPGLKLLEKEALKPVSQKISLGKITHSIPAPEIKKEKGAIINATPNVKPSEKLGHLTTVLDAKSSIKALQSTSTPQTKSSETAKLPTALPDEKSVKPACTITVPVVKPLEKAVHSSVSEMKLSEKPCTKNTMIKPEGHIPIAANIGNKPSLKHNPSVTTVKSEGIKILDIKVAKPTEAIAKIVTVDKTRIKTEPEKVTKPVNNNHSTAVPFGKWTDANRQEFLNKFKEVKTPVSTNSKQIKNSNDLNRRDVLQKIDSQRAQTIINNATAKAQEKVIAKNETVFSSKVMPTKLETKIPVKNESADKKLKQATNKATVKQENTQKAAISSTVTTSSDTAATVATASKVEPTPRDLSTATMASLIDKTIEDMINRVVPEKKVADEPKQTLLLNENEADPAVSAPVIQLPKPVVDDSGTLDDIEMKMNELHGIPFVERPPHELPKVPKPEIKTYSKMDREKSLNKAAKISDITSTSEVKIVKDNVADNIDSEDEVIEHEPVTGDLNLNKKSVPSKLPVHDKKTVSEKSTASISKDANIEAIITETDFDKFARRNSISYENCLTVNFECKEPHSLVQTVKEKNLVPKLNPKTEMICIESKSRIPHKQTIQLNIQTAKGVVTGDSGNKKYHSKIHSAYQSALTAKQVAQPITIIEDKPVKVVFVESSDEFVPSQLNVQGQELSPAKISVPELDIAETVANTDSVDSEMIEVINENKHQDKTKTKHQRKQVLTPVETPELELIQPCDIGYETSPKKKRKVEEVKGDKQSKNMAHKKSYLLGRNTITEDKTSEVTAIEAPKEIIKQTEDAKDHKDTASAIDNLVKAAELLENQEETLNKSITSNTDQPDTPVKRGRGRPRKYPLPEGAADSKTPSPQKKPRLIDAKPIKSESISDEHNDDSSEEDMVRENWTMGKINENIVCPICNKLFRSENVVFKHVKHCTGVSPNRSDSDKRSSRGTRFSQESEDKDMDYDIPISEIKKDTPRKRKSKESNSEIKSEETKSDRLISEVVVVEDTPVKEKPEKHEKEKEEPKKLSKIKAPHRDLVCESCGKKFRQVSHLVSHQMQHKKEQTKKDAQDSNKLQVFSCEVCKKEFRKLHHLVQHRIIHNPDITKRTLRKSSSEQNDTKNIKVEAAAKQNDDSSAAFRCEPCDKSFRKLHHLVEHRETHDGINRQKPVPAQPAVEKPSPPPQCEICKKTFRKLQHLVEHKEQHADTGSEKSDDKSVQSALSTKDIIHECSLCYMVFPNEHSLNKHSVICSKKKRQSKQPPDATGGDSVKDEEKPKSEDKKVDGAIEDAVLEPATVAEEIIASEKNVIEQDNKNDKIGLEQEKVVEVVELENPIVTETTEPVNEKITADEAVENPLPKENVEDKSTEIQSAPAKRDLPKLDGSKMKEISVIPAKIKKIEHKPVKIQDTLKKKTPQKEKIAPTVNKRQKTIDTPIPIVDQAKSSVESSDDDEVRYMLNPNYKVDETTEVKTFMKIRASKRNSLQIERPNSKELVKRRISLQHPPKIPRLKQKAAEPKLKAAQPKQKASEPKPKPKASPKPKPVETKSKVIENKTSSVTPTAVKNMPQSSEVALSIDSDDSDVKYSFPKTVSESLKPSKERTTKSNEKKASRKSLTEKRKSLAGIAKRKSLGKAITAKHKVNDMPPKPIKKRRTEVEHKCDCGQLFGSAALLSRHTSLAHTPPRIRRRRSPPPAEISKPINSSQVDTTKPATRKSSGKSDTSSKSSAARKSSVKSEASNSKKPSALRKSAGRTEAATDVLKSIKPKTTAMTRRSAAFSGIPPPEKMKKLMQKNKK